MNGNFRTSWKNSNKDNESEKNEYSIEVPSNVNGAETPDSGATKPSGENGNLDFKDNDSVKQSEDETQLITIRPMNERQNWTVGWRGTLLSALYFLGAAAVLMFAMNFVHARMPPPASMAILPDLGHEWIPKLEPESLGDIPMMMLIVSLFFYLPFHSRRFPIFTRFCVTMGNLYLLRIISISVTSLPPTDNHCRTDYRPIANIYLNTLKGIISFGGKNEHCGDLMFSGHTCMATNCWLVYMVNCRKRHPAKFIATILLVILIFMIIATRSHYTLDIYIALLLTIFVHRLTPSYFPYTKKKIVRFFKNVF